MHAPLAIPHHGPPIPNRVRSLCLALAFSCFASSWGAQPDAKPPAPNATTNTPTASIPARTALQPQPTPAAPEAAAAATNAFAEWLRKNPEAAARMERARNLTPEERRKAVEAWQRNQQQRRDLQPPAGPQGARPGVPADREARLKLLNERFKERAQYLEKKQQGEQLTEAEAAELVRLKDYIKQYEARPTPTPGSTPPPPAPAPATPTGSTPPK